MCHFKVGSDSVYYMVCVTHVVFWVSTGEYYDKQKLKMRKVAMIRIQNSESPGIDNTDSSSFSNEKWSPQHWHKDSRY